MKFSRERMNADEVRVLDRIIESGGADIKALTTLFRSANAASRARNALRRPRKAAWLRQTGRGSYKATSAGVRGMSTNGAADAHRKNPERTKGTKRATNGARGKLVDSDRLREWRLRLDGLVSATDITTFNTGLVVLASSELGPSSTLIANETGLSRGFVIPRLKKLGMLARKLLPPEELTHQNILQRINVCCAR